jgi:hypothetical protein
MHANSLLLALAAAAAASAQINMKAVAGFRRDTLEARQTDSSECASVALSLVNTLPTPPPALESIVESNTKETAVCAVSVPASLGSEYSSYSSELMSWYSGHSSAISALESCPGVSTIANVIPVCTQGGSAVPTATGAGATAASTSKGAAPRETGMAVAAVAAAGFVLAAL